MRSSRLLTSTALLRRTSSSTVHAAAAEAAAAAMPCRLPRRRAGGPGVLASCNAVGGAAPMRRRFRDCVRCTEGGRGGQRGLVEQEAKRRNRRERRCAVQWCASANGELGGWGADAEATAHRSPGTPHHGPQLLTAQRSKSFRSEVSSSRHWISFLRFHSSL